MFTCGLYPWCFTPPRIAHLETTTGTKHVNFPQFLVTHVMKLCENQLKCPKNRSLWGKKEHGIGWKTPSILSYHLISSHLISSISSIYLISSHLIYLSIYLSISMMLPMTSVLHLMQTRGFPHRFPPSLRSLSSSGVSPKMRRTSPRSTAAEGSGSTGSMATMALSPTKHSYKVG